MGPPTVVVVQMLLERSVDVGCPQLPHVKCPDLVLGPLVSPFDTAFVLVLSRGQKREAQVLAGGLEFGSGSEARGSSRSISVLTGALSRFQCGARLARPEAKTRL